MSFLWWRLVASSVKIEFVASVVVLNVYHGKSPLVQNVIRKYSSSFVPTILSKSQMVHVPILLPKSQLNAGKYTIHGSYAYG